MRTVKNRLVIQFERGDRPKISCNDVVLYDDGGERETPLINITQAESHWLDWINTVNLRSVLDRDAARAEASALTAQVAELIHQAAAHDSVVVSLNSQIAQLEAELDAIRNPPGPDLDTVDGVKAFISDTRYAVEIGGISIEGQVISTERDEIGHWFPRFYDAMQWIAGNPDIRAINPAGSYPYKPKHGSPTVLTAEQVVRAYQCMAWYINACFAVETQLYAAVVAPGADLSQIVELARAEATWPQRTFNWQRPQ